MEGMDLLYGRYGPIWKVWTYIEGLGLLYGRYGPSIWKVLAFYMEGMGLLYGRYGPSISKVWAFYMEGMREIFRIFSLFFYFCNRVDGTFTFAETRLN